MFAIVSYLFAYLGGSSPVGWQMLLGTVVFALGTGATNMINAYTDISEDSVNNPFRLDWIRRFGIAHLIRAIIAAYSLTILLSLPLGLAFTSVVFLAIADSVFYSLPPIRLKKNPITALLAFSGAVGLPFLAGRAVVGQLRLLDPWFYLFTVFMLTYGTVKNVPDFLGDELAGLKTTATAFRDFRKAVTVSTMLLLAPYLLITLFVVTGLLGSVYLLNLSLLVVPLYWAHENVQSHRREVLEKLHTLGFLYALLFLLLNLILSYPTLTSLAITASVSFAILVVSKLNVDSRMELPFNAYGVNLDGSERLGIHRD
jgi:4-hydroxybenzoate polyprenyltransferase